MSEPIDMVLHCPRCGKQHIYEPDDASDWDNPPHRSHLCHGCGCGWRPADVETNGVHSAVTRGQKDTWPQEDTEKSLVLSEADRSLLLQLLQGIGASADEDKTISMCKRLVKRLAKPQLKRT